jgi:hypothetical protein
MKQQALHVSGYLYFHLYPDALLTHVFNQEENTMKMFNVNLRLFSHLPDATRAYRHVHKNSPGKYLDACQEVHFLQHSELHVSIELQGQEIMEG